MEVDDMPDQVRHDARIVLFATVHESRARSRETHEFGLQTGDFVQPANRVLICDGRKFLKPIETTVHFLKITFQAPLRRVCLTALVIGIMEC